MEDMEDTRMHIGKREEPIGKRYAQHDPNIWESQKLWQQ